MPLKKTLKDLTDDARLRITEIDCSELTAMLEAREQPHPVVIDVREPDERARGYIPDSYFIPRGILERDIEKIAYKGRVTDEDLNRPIVLYCASGNRSLLAGDMLKQMGFTTVYSLEGGYKAWGATGAPITHDRAG